MQRSKRLYEWKRRNHLQRQVLGDGDNGFLSRLISFISLKKIFVDLVMSMLDLSGIKKLLFHLLHKIFVFNELILRKHCIYMSKSVSA